MTAPSSILDWYMRNAPRGVECVATGSTLVGTSTGVTFQSAVNETWICDKLVVTWESGVSFTSVTLNIPSQSITQALQTSVLTREQFQIYCDDIKELNGSRQEKFFPQSGNTFYQHTKIFRPPIVMINSETYNYFSVVFNTIAGGCIYVKPCIWRVKETDDGV